MIKVLFTILSNCRSRWIKPKDVLNNDVAGAIISKGSDPQKGPVNFACQLKPDTLIW